jgi:hypothetical protein
MVPMHPLNSSMFCPLDLSLFSAGVHRWYIAQIVYLFLENLENDA